MAGFDRLLLFGIRYGPGDFEDLVICPCGYTELQDRHFEKLFTFLIEHAVLFDILRFEVSVKEDRAPLITLLLNFPRPVHAFAYEIRGIAFSALRQLLIL